MNEVDYINSVVGTPYKTGSDGGGSFDCWGIVVDSFRNIEQTEIPKAIEREECNLNESSVEYLKTWTECTHKDAHIFCCYQGDRMVHVGRVLGKNFLHAFGDENNGQVMVWSKRKITMIYKNIRFFKYANN
jgi:cell wall-associated NlpC family hydrolase